LFSHLSSFVAIVSGWGRALLLHSLVLFRGLDE
jgi:hypothetical protein